MLGVGKVGPSVVVMVVVMADLKVDVKVDVMVDQRVDTWVVVMDASSVVGMVVQ